MADEAVHPIRICDSATLQERADGVRFVVERPEGAVPAFVVRYEGRAYAYVNRCAHVGVELDWEHGRFFDSTRLYLICATHGALYEPHSGYCVGGPCKGRRLEPLGVVEREGAIFLKGTTK